MLKIRDAVIKHLKPETLNFLCKTLNAMHILNTYHYVNQEIDQVAIFDFLL